MIAINTMAAAATTMGNVSDETKLEEEGAGRAAPAMSGDCVVDGVIEGDGESDGVHDSVIDVEGVMDSEAVVDGVMDAVSEADAVVV
jgi:hypothetical protein